MKTFLAEAPSEHPARLVAEDILKASAAGPNPR
jgi:hypothetical protein